jgi:hypothetical protein
VSDLRDVPLVRLTSRALDGAFRDTELPALILRIALYGETGRIELKQNTSVRAFAFRRGRLLEIDTTEDEEAFEQHVVGLEGEVLARAKKTAREEEMSLAQVLRQNKAIEAQVIDQAERAYARRVITGCIDGGDAIAWFDRRHQPPPEVTTDLYVQSAIWAALTSRWPAANRAALARRAAATNLEVVAGAEPLLIHLGGATPVELGAPQQLSEEQLAGVGGMVLCGVVRPGATAKR